MYILRLLFLNRLVRWTLRIQFPSEIKANERSLLLIREVIYFQVVSLTLYFLFMVISTLAEFLVPLITNSEYEVSFWIFNGMFFIHGAITLNKDLVNGQGIVNRHFGYRVVDAKTEITSTPIKCMLRNLTAILFPFEFIFLQWSDKRLGDLLFGTKLLKVTPTPPETILTELKNYKWDMITLIAIMIPLLPSIVFLTWMTILNYQ
tara:strand:+ start:6777 stop:7391 length:615 start_codon:yes stop_codon:yes gene_type:complete